MVRNSETIIEPLYLPGLAKELKMEDPAASRQEEFQTKCHQWQGLNVNLNRNNKERREIYAYTQ